MKKLICAVMSTIMAFSLCVPIAAAEYVPLVPTYQAPLAPAAPAAAQMTAVIPSFPIRINGQVIDNSSAQYPVLVYQNIAYVPLTYHFSRFLGIVTYWDVPTNTFMLRRSSVRGAYVPDTGYTHSSNYLPVSILSCNVAINSVSDRSVGHEFDGYPFISYNGIVYLPVTGTSERIFGWAWSWDPVTGLVLDLTRKVDQPLLDWETTFAGTPLQ